MRLALFLHEYVGLVASICLVVKSCCQSLLPCPLSTVILSTHYPNAPSLPKPDLNPTVSQLSYYLQKEEAMADQEKYEPGVRSCGSICNFSCGSKRSMSNACSKSQQQYRSLSELELFICGSLDSMGEGPWEEGTQQLGHTSGWKTLAGLMAFILMAACDGTPLSSRDWGNSLSERWRCIQVYPGR